VMRPAQRRVWRFCFESTMAFSPNPKTMRIYRMHRSARAAGDYTGAMLAGGRWNSIGTPVLYTAQHLSLTCVEVWFISTRVSA